MASLSDERASRNGAGGARSSEKPALGVCWLCLAIFVAGALLAMLAPQPAWADDPTSAATQAAVCPTPVDASGLTGVEFQVAKLRREQSFSCSAVIAALGSELKVSIRDVNVPPGSFSTRTAGELPVADSTVRAAFDMDGETIATQRVRLSTTDREKFDLTWYGVWLFCGIAIAQLLAPSWNRAWKWFRD